MHLAQQPWPSEVPSVSCVSNAARPSPAPSHESASGDAAASSTGPSVSPRWGLGVESTLERVRHACGNAIDRVRDTAFAREPADVELAMDGVVEPSSRSELACRALNLGLAALSLVLLLPLLLLLAVGVKLSSRGPVLYTQTRVGIDRRWSRTRRWRDRRRVDLGGKTFTIYKFRSMRHDAEVATGAVWAASRDPRTTPFGRFLRQYHLDEIPQLLNVLRGDMNFVGPRPERPSIVARLRSNVQGYELRQRVKPGITGLAQIHLRYDSSIEDVRRKLRYDVLYLRRQCLWLDLLILLRTGPAVLSSARDR
jgi:lipopolysaccharide/colanic/teichoic acid biosynthesis glycosyltransferase